MAQHVVSQTDSETEDSMIRCGLAMLTADSGPARQRSRKTSYKQRSYSQAIQQSPKVRQTKQGPTVNSSWTMYDKAAGQVIGNTRFLIRGAGPLDIIAYLMDVNGRHFRSGLDPHKDICFELREVRNAHHFNILRGKSHALS